MKRKPRTPKKVLKAEVDKLWSLYIRKRFKHLCQYCGRAGNNPHHIFGKGAYRAMRHDPENGILLCWSHHAHLAHKNPEKFRDWLIKRLGQDAFDKLKLRATLTHKSDYAMNKIVLENLLREAECLLL